MDTQEIMEYMAAMPAAEQDYKTEWEATRFMLNGKMFAYLGNNKAGRPILTLKLPLVMNEALRAEHDFICEGYYMNKAHWSSVYLDVPCPDDLMRNLCETAYRTLLDSLPLKTREKIRKES